MAKIAVLTNGGRERIQRLVKKEAVASPTHISWGTGNGAGDATAANRADSALQAEAAEARVAATTSLVTTTTANDTMRWVGTLTCAGANKQITEAGVHDAGSAGLLFIHATFGGADAIGVSIGESIEFTIEHQLT